MEFYDKYIRQQDKEFCEEELRKIEREFLSNKLIKKIKLTTEYRDMDPIVNAQDVFIEWLDSIKVKKINSKDIMCIFLTFMITDMIAYN